MFKEILKKFLPPFFISWYHFLLAFLGAFFYQFPSRQRRDSSTRAGKKMVVVGVTGTNGKSTVVELASRILEEAGYKVASLSSIKFKIGEKEWENLLKQTMPGRFQLQKFLKKALDSGCQYVVLEVTSEGILQHRHRFIDFDIAVFTNLTPEHIEAHGSFEKYKEAKGKLFQSLKGKKISVVNLDDKNSDYFLNFPADEKYGFKIKNKKSKIKNPYKKLKIIEAENLEIQASGIKFSMNGTDFNLNLLGEFNIYNSLAAICVGLSQGISLKNCKLALEKVQGIPGRMEIVISDPFRIIIDYAFTPAALEKVYQTLKPTANQFICVLGSAGGGRDKWKRPVLGKLAGTYCDQVIITNEDPYNEDPMEIINQVAQGCSSSAKKILDRREAIREAINLAKPEDLVIITGKGSEPWMCVEKGRKIPWDDREITREEFRKIYGKV